MGKTAGRSTVYNYITTLEKLKDVNIENTRLEEDFIEYLESIDRSAGTISQYRANLHIFWCWNLENNGNKCFVDLTKREVAKFQNYAINVWGWSPKRLRTFKSTLSSLSNFISNILDDEYKDYKPIIRKIESPADTVVREKTVLTPGELQPLLTHLVEKEQYMKACLLALAMYSGRRKAEITRFKVSYFDDANLICGGALYKTPEKMVTKGRGKRGKLLDVYVLAHQFKPYLDYWLEERKRLGIESDWLFPKQQNGQWLDEPIGISTIDSCMKTFSRLLQRPIYAHMFRHHFCTELSNQGIPDNVIKEIVGWESLEMVSLYNDRSTEDTLDMYFDANGIKQVEKKNLNDL